MKINQILASTTLIAGLALPILGQAADTTSITKGLDQVAVKHDGKPVTITRSQEHRPCPPFCVQPMHAAPGVETIGELELLDYLKKMSEGDGSILVVDSRTPEWTARGTIPGAVNVPWTRITLESAEAWDSTASNSFKEALAEFGVVDHKGMLDFSNAKTLVLFCNGAWCGQSATNIKTLVKHGYPADKLKWYRGGMQSWTDLGLTTAK